MWVANVLKIRTKTDLFSFYCAETLVSSSLVIKMAIFESRDSWRHRIGWLSVRSLVLNPTCQRPVNNMGKVNFLLPSLEQRYSECKFVQKWIYISYHCIRVANFKFWKKTTALIPPTLSWWCLWRMCPSSAQLKVLVHHVSPPTCTLHTRNFPTYSQELLTGGRWFVELVTPSTTRGPKCTRSNSSEFCIVPKTTFSENFGSLGCFARLSDRRTFILSFPPSTAGRSCEPKT